MQKMLLKSFTTMAAVGLLAGCMSQPLLPGANKVVLTYFSVPQDCRPVGEVASQDINGITAMYTSHDKMQTAEERRLKNEAVQLGGNVVYITSHKVTFQPKDRSGSSLIATHSMSGEAYACPMGDLK